MSTHYVGIDVGGTKMAYGLFDEDRQLLGKYKYPSDPEMGPEAFVATVREHMDRVLGQNALTLDDIHGVGLCLPSFIDYDKGYVLRTANLKQVKEFPARQMLEKALGCRVLLDNDANVAALAELRYGAGKGQNHMLYFAISTGISTGIIINKQVFRGSYGWAGETGHMIANVESGRREDTFENNASGGHIVEVLAQRMREGAPSAMLEMCGGKLEKLNAHHLEDAYNLGDELAIWGLDRMGTYIGTWLYNLYLTFNIGCHVFGGGLTNMGDMLFGRIRGVFDSLNRDPDTYPVDFHFAQLGQDFGIIGAVEQLFDQ